jgi:hypothetical protein
MTFNATIINKFLKDIVTSDQAMFEGTWDALADEVSDAKSLFKHLEFRAEGKTRVFLFRS